MKVVILAAGIGSRLGRQLPKPLSLLSNGKTLLGNQIDIFRDLGIKEIFVVVGFKKEIIMESISNVFFVYNSYFHISNTAKSLELAFSIMEPDDVVWTNGDLFLEKGAAEKILNYRGNAIGVNNCKCLEEEVKYTLDSMGFIKEISKEVPLDLALGEAVGINKITKKDFETFLSCLKKCDMQDYFEKAIELSIRKEGLSFKPVDLSRYRCIEVDFLSDLKKVNAIITDNEGE